MKTAVVLFNLGGPSSLESVRPFLFNLFNDPAIIGLPQPFRGPIAATIAIRRAPLAKKIYALMGGSSPLLANTLVQAEALEARLGDGYKTFVVMRYWHPRAAQQIAAVMGWAPDLVLLLPLYPQYSTTTTGSSLREWEVLSRRHGFHPATRAICCWPVLSGFVTSVTADIDQALARIPQGIPVRILFSAHGLPKKVIAGGDPYQYQVERSVASVVTALNRPELDYQLCYQSRVGPLQWLEPSIGAEIERAGAEGVGLVVVPIAFVSEHSETLVELDHDYRILADKAGVPAYERVTTVGTSADFIASIEELIRSHTAPDYSGDASCSAEPGWECPTAFGRCGARQKGAGYG